MKHSATRALFTYWNDLRGARAAPERSDIEPAAIRDILADTFMLDLDLAQRFPFRLAGTRVNGLFEAEQKGRSFLDLWRGEERRNIAAILLTVADNASPVVAGCVSTGRDNDQECALELLFLPLRHHGRTHARILGLVKLASNPGWLRLTPLGPFSLRSLRMIDIDECELQRPKKLVVGQQTHVSDIGPPSDLPGSLVKRPNLRVIQGGL